MWSWRRRISVVQLCLRRTKMGSISGFEELERAAEVAVKKQRGRRDQREEGLVRYSH